MQLRAINIHRLGLLNNDEDNRAGLSLVVSGNNLGHDPRAKVLMLVTGQVCLSLDLSLEKIDLLVVSLVLV